MSIISNSNYYVVISNYYEITILIILRIPSILLFTLFITSWTVSMLILAAIVRVLLIAMDV